MGIFPGNVACLWHDASTFASYQPTGLWLAHDKVAGFMLCTLAWVYLPVFNFLTACDIFLFSHLLFVWLSSWSTYQCND